MDIHINNIGIVGGVGPLAGIDLHVKIIKNTIAQKDQDHVPVYHISCSHCITDRTEYYLNQTLRNPAIDMFTIITQLNQLRCKVIGIPCNSAHIPCIREPLEHMIQESNFSNELELLHLVKEVGIHLKALGIQRPGLLATKGTIQSGLYKDTLEQMGIQIIVPTTDEQVNRIHDSIYNPDYGIKSTPTVTDTARKILLEEVSHLKQVGSECVILGCTELPLALTQDMIDIPLMDATNIFARALIHKSNPSKLRKMK